MDQEHLWSSGCDVSLIRYKLPARSWPSVFWLAAAHPPLTYINPWPLLAIRPSLLPPGSSRDKPKCCPLYYSQKDRPQKNWLMVSGTPAWRPTSWRSGPIQGFIFSPGHMTVLLAGRASKTSRLRYCNFPGILLYIGPFCVHVLDNKSPGTEAGRGRVPSTDIEAADHLVPLRSTKGRLERRGPTSPQTQVWSEAAQTQRRYPGIFELASNLGRRDWSRVFRVTGRSTSRILQRSCQKERAEKKFPKVSSTHRSASLPQEVLAGIVGSIESYQDHTCPALLCLCRRWCPILQNRLQSGRSKGCTRPGSASFGHHEGSQPAFLRQPPAFTTRKDSPHSAFSRLPGSAAHPQSLQKFDWHLSGHLYGRRHFGRAAKASAC